MPTIITNQITFREPTNSLKISNLQIDPRLVYGTRWWRLNRLAKLEEQPLCERCLAKEIITPATDVHHIVPFSRMGNAWREYAFDYSNLMSLCEKCHHEIHIELSASETENDEK